MTWRRWLADNIRLLWLLSAMLVYLLFSAYQLGLPGLHYDEAKEAGVNAMELISGLPVTPFRGAALDIAGAQLPLMVQDYIGALNVYLAAPFLAVTGVGVPNLRMLPVLTGLLTLLLAERAISEWIACCDRRNPSERAPISFGGVAAVTLLAVSPSFIFWSRQGIFVTNLMQPFCFLTVWQGVRWMRTGRSGSLFISALAAGLALYAKLLAVWIIAPFALLMAAWWISHRIRSDTDAPSISPLLLLASALAFALPLGPIVLFNAKTGGTLSTLIGNAQHSYYGVDNLHILANSRIRAGQLIQVFRGDQFWYLGGSYANSAAPWFATAAIVAGLLRAPRVVLPPLSLAGLSALASIFTISDLFVTHYALVYPFVVGVSAIALDRIWMSFITGDQRSRVARASVAILLVLWVAGNSASCVRYHRALARTGGLADHSDATYHLAYYLRYNGLGAPIALDWGLDAPVRFLSQGTVTPIEIFGYESLSEPDAGYADRLEQFLSNPDNVYLLHEPDHTVFAGRREALLHVADEHNLDLEKAEVFRQRDGQPLFEVWRARPQAGAAP